MTDITTIKFLLTTLEGLQQRLAHGHPLDNDHRRGICTAIIPAIASARRDGVCITRSQVLRLFDELVRTWPRFSGDTVYPVPSPASRPEYMTHRHAYNDAYRDMTLWDKDTAYARARHELLAYVIERLREMYARDAIGAFNVEAQQEEAATKGDAR